MSMTKRGFTALAVLLLGVGAMGLVASAPAGAAETTYDACPDEAGSFTDDGTPYPPFGAPEGDASGLIDCTSSYTPPVDAQTNLSLLFEFPGLPTDACYEITELSVTSTGTPGGAGWGFLAFDSVGTVPIDTVNGNGGSFVQYDALTGTVLPANGVPVESPIDQPATGTYAVTSSLATDVISLDDLAAGNLGGSVLILNSFVGGGADTVESMTASVTLDDANCDQPTTTTAPTTTVAPTTVAPAPAPAVAVADQPRFTG
jgi:hypothetical protein